MSFMRKDIFVRRDIAGNMTHDYPVTVQAVNKSYTIRLLSSGAVYWAQCIRIGPGNVPRVLGNRYAANHTKYFSAWDPSPEDKSAIRTYIGDGIETLTVFTRSGRTVVPITSIDRLEQYIPVFHPLTVVPQYVIEGFLRDVVHREELCPITMEPIRRGDACVTPCFHAMSYDAAATWIRMHSRCPMCRMACHITQLYK